jgi:Rrf2 family transcriptional regulator, iron-sulfur cluster assembly transcription factor
MIFSKTFGYALRGVLYIAVTSNEAKNVRIEDISRRIGIPKYFLAKIMNKIAKEGIIVSIKGPNGGFSSNSRTLGTALIDIYQVVDQSDRYDSCVLYLKKCTGENPCPMHYKVEETKNNIKRILAQTTIGQLVNEGAGDFIKSITFK